MLAASRPVSVRNPWDGKIKRSKLMKKVPKQVGTYLENRGHETETVVNFLRQVFVTIDLGFFHAVGTLGAIKNH